MRLLLKTPQAMQQDSIPPVIFITCLSSSCYLFWRWGLIWSTGDLPPDRSVFPRGPWHGTYVTVSCHAHHGADTGSSLACSSSFPAQGRTKEHGSVLPLPRDCCHVCPSSTFYRPPIYPATWAAWHLPGGTPALANLNSGLNVHPERSKGAQSFPCWKVLKEQFIRALACSIWKLKTAARKSRSLRQLCCSSPHQSLSTS